MSTYINDGGLRTVSNYSVSIFSGLNQMGIAVDKVSQKSREIV